MQYQKTVQCTLQSECKTRKNQDNSSGYLCYCHLAKMRKSETKSVRERDQCVNKAHRSSVSDSSRVKLPLLSCPFGFYATPFPQLFVFRIVTWAPVINEQTARSSRPSIKPKSITNTADPVLDWKIFWRCVHLFSGLLTDYIHDNIFRIFFYLYNDREYLSLKSYSLKVQNTLQFKERFYCSLPSK